MVTPMQIKFIISAFLCGMLLWSCSTFNQHVMLRVPKDFQYDTAPAIPDSLYKVAPNDLLRLRILAGNGEDLLSGEAGEGQALTQQLQVRVEYDGKIKLPVIGRVSVAGLTVRELEDSLESRYAVYYQAPFVQAQIDNKQVIVFPGTGSDAKVVKFERETMNVFEALAQAGGISVNGKAHRIKLIRGDLKNPIVLKIDLSTIEGMKSADLALQSGDIIYVDTRENFARIFMTNIQPYVLLISSTATIITAIAIFTSLGK